MVVLHDAEEVITAPASTGLAPTATKPLRDTARELLEAFFRGRNANTLRAYRKDLENFAVFLQLPAVEYAARKLLSCTAGDGNALVLRYRDTMLEQRYTPSTINRRLSAVKSLLKIGRLLGFCSWSVEIDPVRSDRYRDTRGPGVAAVGEMLKRVSERGDAKGLRDAAIVRLLFDCGLRRGELVELDRSHYNALRGLHLLGKGRLERQWVTVSPAARMALDAWLTVRGAAPGPLFIALDEKHRGHRLTGTAVYQIVSGLGDAIGVRARPHGLRHSAITEALDRTNGDMRAVARFSRHRDISTLAYYDDSRRDEAGRIARLISLPDTEQAMVAPACARGHLYAQNQLPQAREGRALFCCRGECKDGHRGDLDRRIEERAFDPSSSLWIPIKDGQ